MSDAPSAGGCLCGGVRYEVRGRLRDVWSCHCSQCRRTSGNFVAATNTPNEAFALLAQETLAWYRSSDSAERGFCARCGGNLFWRRVGGDSISIMAGTLDTPTRLKLVGHIFVASKSDYYEISDGTPQHAEWSR